MVQTLSSFIFELWTLAQVQKCDKNNEMSILAPGDRPCAQKTVFPGGTGWNYAIRNFTSNTATATLC
jgi:hypothetical protein